ncbi:hypothetical protein M405DRAFT_805114 [Rhizopogon salebrosus TDB-379]|nr:hypothetical protein M405DRAFT_805114 [Rhizopogon salebrosus TDB-379]
MFSIWKRNSASPTQVIGDIDGVLDAILTLCTDNFTLLTQAERSSFMNAYSSLTDSRGQLNKGTKYSKLTEVLDECEALELKIQLACRKHRENQIRGSGQVSPVASSTTEGREPSEVSPVTSSTTEGREPSIAPVEPGPDRAPSFVDSVSDNIDYGTNLATNGSSQQPPSMSTGASAFTPDTHISQQTTTETSTVLSREDIPSASRINDTDCMVFDVGSSAGSPTFNIDSEGATGATNTIPGNGGPRTLPQAHRRPAAGVYQSQAARVVRERTMYFGPDTTSDSPTFNIRSKGASGACGESPP